MALIQLDHMASSIERWTTTYVYSPQDEVAGEGPFDMAILLHGYCGNHTDWLMRTTITQQAAALGLVLVMPDGDNSFYLDYPERSELYETYIAKELPTLIQRGFNVKKDPAHTYILGLSMGGGGALRIGAKYGDVFSKAAGLSSGLCLGVDGEKLGHGADVMKAYEVAMAEGKPLSKIYVACGSEDPMLAENRQFHAFLEEKGIPHVYKEPAGAHTFAFWDSEGKKALHWFMEKEETLWQS